MTSRTVLRLFFATVVVASALAVAVGYLAAADRDTTSEMRTQAELDSGERDAVAPPADGVTVIATDSNTLSDREFGPRSNAELVAFNPNGTVLYYEDSHSVYWDVDPDPAGELTVVYAASDHLSEDECGRNVECTRNVIERVNLSTGEVEPLYSRITPGVHATRWHDVDRVDEDHFAVADIARDRVFVVNVTSELVVWEWDALSEFDPDGGGPYPEDWTHVNDVEVLDDGRLMVSLRNQDQVVFLDPETGMDHDWTLGSEDDYDVLYEQHNPDFIPGERGGPAVVVADSENNRVVEYQREDGGERTNGSRASSDSSDGDWERTWVWTDERLQWPRDADRLPDGNTLVTDSNGNRVIEVDPDGEVVWSVDVPFPYEAERLGTGGESDGGESAEELGLRSRTVDSGEEGADVEAGLDRSARSDPVVLVTAAVKRVVPGRLLNGVMYVTPVWMDVGELLALVIGAIIAIVWIAAEIHWSSVSVGLRSPVTVRRR